VPLWTPLMLERPGLALLQGMPPECAHRLALVALNSGLAARPGPVTSPRLQTELAGMALPNPVGLAAGFDKNARAVGALSAAGFGFLEVGAATPRPQHGNPKPRLFRLDADRAVINRLGFNNDGVRQIAKRLARQPRPRTVPVGLNLGVNRDSADRAGDFAAVVRLCSHCVDFVTVNVSSPNTKRLRALQGKAALSTLLADVMRASAPSPAERPPLPVFLKIAPDLDDAALADVATAAVAANLSGLIATNTTLARGGLQSRHRNEAGGLSGQPLFDRSTRVLARLSVLTDGALPIIGVGGVASGAQAYAKIMAGAGAVQLYTGLVYGGLGLVRTIARDLDALLQADGFANVAGAVGQGRDAWL